MKLRPAVIVPTLLVLAACADTPTGSGNGAPIEHATGSDDVLVRVEIGGGLVSSQENLTNQPVFTLYGDGTVIIPGAQIEIYPGPALPAISTRSVNEAGIQTILSEAIGAVDDLPADLDDTGDFQVIADAPTTTITVDAGGAIHTVGVFALEDMERRPQGIADDVYEARLGLLRLITELGNLDSWLPATSLGDETTYRGDAARIYISRYRPAPGSQEPISWPLDGALSLSAPMQRSRNRCETLDGEDWSAVRDAAGRANQLTPWTDAGDRFSILFRPLLPDESGC